MEFWERFGGRVIVDVLACLLSVQTAFYSDLDLSSLVCFANWFGRVREPLFLIPIDGAPSIRPDLSFQLQHMWGFCFGPLAVAAAAAFVKKLFGASRAPFTAPFPFSVVSLSSYGIHIAQLVTQLKRRQQQQGSNRFAFPFVTSSFSVESMWSARNAEDSGTAKRRRERRLRQFLRHERLSVAMALAESTHHAAPRGQRMARARGWVRGALHGPTPQEPGTQHFFLDDDSVPELGGFPPDRLPQEQVLRHTVEQLGDVAPGLPALDVLVPLDDLLKIVDLFVPEQEIEVPKISSLLRLPLRRVFPVPQTVEQLVEVPTEPVYVLMVLASKVFSRRELARILSGQGSTASGSEQIVDNPVPQSRRRRGGRPGQNSTAADVEQTVDIPARGGLQGFSASQGPGR